ncbi:uncharacterized protein EV154DRAFT_479210 [Mucor mucedo]|uniref:uncharacterized protein n=1 Tax=Mucor mucedo TaxID=29922 RepID=UPI002220E7C5|nr:uncharacterized protein EV154DRAFT_479210 [Mucor mucedo]KAI7893458.1 hypothetical protein EV154DRAFT_479210 [Mucor mucedo]
MPLTSEPTNSPQTWKNKFLDFYIWSKVLSITLNMMYMIQTFDDMYEAGANIGTEYIKFVKVLMSLFLQSKITVADWYWRPGVFFFTFTCGNEIILIVDLLFSNETFFQNCQQKLTGTHTSLVLISEVCLMQSRLNHIVTLSVIFRDILICVRNVFRSKVMMLTHLIIREFMSLLATFMFYV